MPKLYTFVTLQFFNTEEGSLLWLSKISAVRHKAAFYYDLTGCLSSVYIVTIIHWFYSLLYFHVTHLVANDAGRHCGTPRLNYSLDTPIIQDHFLERQAVLCATFTHD